MIRNSPCVSVPVETLQELRRLFICFEDDAASNLLPEEKNIRLGRDLISSALHLPRTFTERSEAYSIAAE